MDYHTDVKLGEYYGMGRVLEFTFRQTEVCRCIYNDYSILKQDLEVVKKDI